MIKGQKFEDHYKLCRVLGRGNHPSLLLLIYIDTHAEVRLCVNKATKLDRAVKIYKKKNLYTDKASKQRFLTEIEIFR